MSRPLRIEYENALYHVTSRGNARDDIYIDDDSRLLFMQVIAEVCDLFNWSLHSWCLMDNHYHLLVRTPDANLSKGMRYLNGVYTQRFNKQEKRVGHVFQGRYKAIVVEEQSYLLELSRHIVLNPVRAGMVESAEQYEWSSYQVLIGKKGCPKWFDKKWMLNHFGKSKNIAIQNYMQFVADGVQQASPWSLLKNQIYLGSDGFVEDVQMRIGHHHESKEIPKVQTRAIAKSLKEYVKMNDSRNAAIIMAYRSGGFTLSQIGAYFSLHYSTVSRIIHSKMKK